MNTPPATHPDFPVNQPPSDFTGRAQLAQGDLIRWRKTKKPPGKPDGFFELVAGAGFDLKLRRVVSGAALTAASHCGLFRTAA
jgi:hypothetical protein